MADAPLPTGTTPGRLGDKIERTMMRFLLGVYNSTIGLLSQRIRAGIDRWTEQLETVMVEWYGPLVDDILASPSLTPSIRHLLERVRHPTSQVGAVVATVAAGGAASGIIGGAINPISRIVGHMIDIVVQSAVPDPTTLARLRWRGAFDAGYYDRSLKQLGIPDAYREWMEEIARPWLGAGDLFAHAHRFETSDGEARNHLFKLGYTIHEIDKLRDLTTFMPGPADLVRMGVREVWKPEVVAKWGYGADFPTQFGVEMKRLGDAEDWAHKFWYAHWMVPSVTMGLEMLHRQVITDAEFRELLLINDIPAGWRDKIEKIAYHPYTRVDTRRMFRLDVLGVDDVYNTYRDLGYDDEHAQNMTLFTVRDALEEERSVTKSDILMAYRLGRLSPGEARQGIIDAGYNAWVADIQIANVDVKRANELASETIGYVKTMYVNSQITRPDAVSQLAAISIPGSEVNRYIEEWDIARKAKMKRPTRAHYEEFFKSGLMSLDDYRRMLETFGYATWQVTLYLGKALQDKREKNEKEAERARKEREDVEKRTVTTAYQRDKAVLNVDIAEIATAIAETQIALGARRDRYDLDRSLAEEAISVDTLRRAAQADVDRFQIDVDMLGAEIDGLRIEIESRETEIVRIRENVLAAADETQIDALQAEIASLHTEIEHIQDTIAGQRTIITEERVTISQADVPAEVVSLTEEIDTLSIEIGEAYVLIDDIQTNIASWMEQAFLTDEIEMMDTIRSNVLHARLQIEQIQDIIAEHRVAITTAKARLRTLDVPENIQELVSDIDVLTISISREQAQIESLQTAIVEHRAQIEQEDRTERDDEILLQITILERQNEENQDAIRLLARDRDIARANLRRRREKLNRDVANLERVRNVVLVERQYNEDVAKMKRRLGEFRLNSMELREQLASLAVEYRTGVTS